MGGHLLPSATFSRASSRIVTFGAGSGRAGERPQPDGGTQTVRTGLGLEHAGIDRRGRVESPGGAEARAEGQAEARRSDLFEVLQQRFGTPVSPDLVSTIRKLADLEILSRWFRAGLKAESLDAFRAQCAG